MRSVITSLTGLVRVTPLRVARRAVVIGKSRLNPARCRSLIALAPRLSILPQTRAFSITSYLRDDSHLRNESPVQPSFTDLTTEKALSRPPRARLFVEATHAGYVIGLGASRIKSIREEFNCNIYGPGRSNDNRRFNGLLWKRVDIVPREVVEGADVEAKERLIKCAVRLEELAGRRNVVLEGVVKGGWTDDMLEESLKEKAVWEKLGLWEEGLSEGLLEGNGWEAGKEGPMEEPSEEVRKIIEEKKEEVARNMEKKEEKNIEEKMDMAL